MRTEMKPVWLLLVGVLLASTATAQGSSSQVAVDLIKTEPVPLRTSEYADVWLRVKNNGSAVAQNTVVEFVETFPFSTDPDEKTRWNIGELVSGATYFIHLQVQVDENAVHGTNDLTFRTTTGDGRITITETVPVEVRTDDAALIVNDIGFPDTVAPGTAQDLTITVENAADSYLKNIDIALDIEDDDLPFATADTTRKRLQKLAPGATATPSFRLYTDEDAENGVYKVPITLDYEDEAGTEFSRRELTGIVVGGEPLLDVGIQERNLMTAGTAGRLTLRIVNRGEGRARFVKLSLPASEQYEVLSTDSVYLGDMDADDYQTAEFQLYAQPDAANLTLPVRLTYRDAAGTTRTSTAAATVPLYTGSQLQQFGLAQQRSPWMVAALLIVAGVVALFWWRRR